MATLLGSLEGPLRMETEFAVAPTHSAAREKPQNTSVIKQGNQVDLQET